MGYTDIVVLVVLGLGMWRGFQGGAIKEVAQIFGMLVAFMMGLQLMNVVGDIVSEILGVDSSLAPALGFVTVFLVLLLIVHFLTKFISYLMKSMKLGFIDKFSGGLLGALKAALVISIVMIPLSEINIPSNEQKEESALYPAVEAVAPITWSFAKRFWPSAQSISDKIGGRLKKQIGVEEEEAIDAVENTVEIEQSQEHVPEPPSPEE